MNNSEILIYQNSEGSIKIDVRLEEESVWLNQTQMAELFGKGRTTITEHIQNVFSEGELEENVVCRNFRHTTQHGAIEGKTQETTTKYYNLDVIISVGYRVKSPQGTQFRIWAGYSGQNDQSSPDEIDHSHKTEPELFEYTYFIRRRRVF